MKISLLSKRRLVEKKREKSAVSCFEQPPVPHGVMSLLILGSFSPVTCQKVQGPTAVLLHHSCAAETVRVQDGGAGSA